MNVFVKYSLSVNCSVNCLVKQYDRDGTLAVCQCLIIAKKKEEHL